MIFLPFEDVREFHKKFEVPMPDTLSLLNDEAYNFRVEFLKEEQNEFKDSFQKRNFEGCIDALLDEVYVACGTSLMMGVDFLNWLENYDKVITEDQEICRLKKDTGFSFTDLKFLSDDEYNKAINLLGINLNNFIHFHYYGDINKCTESMLCLVILCYDISNHMGIDWATWRELFSDVHRANMSKIRATDASQSKRKTSLDVIKPPGWIGPNADKILEKNFPDYKNRL